MLTTKERIHDLGHMAERLMYYGKRIQGLLDSSEPDESKSTQKVIDATNELIECLVRLEENAALDFVRELATRETPSLVGGRLETQEGSPEIASIDAKSAYPFIPNAQYGKGGTINEPSMNEITHRLFAGATKALPSVISAGDYTAVNITFEKPVTLSSNRLLVIDDETQSIPSPNRLLDYLPLGVLGNLRLTATVGEASVYFTVNTPVRIYEQKPYARTPQDRTKVFHRLPSWDNLIEMCSMPWKDGTEVKLSLSFDNQVLDTGATAAATLVQSRIDLGGELDSLGIEPVSSAERSPGLVLMKEGFDEYMARQNLDIERITTFADVVTSNPKKTSD